VALARDEEDVADGHAEDGRLGDGHRLLRADAEDVSEDRHQQAAASDAGWPLPADASELLEIDGEDILTDYVATRWYRAPEILVGSDKYGIEVDMWSLGCIFGEMLAGKPVFNGTSTLNQIEKIVDKIGMPDEDTIAHMKSPFAKSMIDNLPPAVGKKGPKSYEEQLQAWATTYPDASADAVDIMTRLMQFDPTQRLTARARDSRIHTVCSFMTSRRRQSRHGR